MNWDETLKLKHALQDAYIAEVNRLSREDREYRRKHKEPARKKRKTK